MFSPTPSRCPLATVLAAGVALSFAVGAALVIFVAIAGPASAHAVLVKITPGSGAQLTIASTVVVLEFDEPVGAVFATLVVTAASGVSVARGEPTVTGPKVTQQLSPNLASGGYRVAYRLVSDDGHAVSGGSSFALMLTSRASSPGSTVTPSSSASASATAATRDAQVAAVPSPKGPGPQQDGWLSRYLLPFGAGGGIAVNGGGVLLWDRQRR